MNEVQRKINEAHRLLFGVAVKGDDVEAMSAAKLLLREAFAAAGDSATQSPRGKGEKKGGTENESETAGSDNAGRDNKED